MSKVLISGLGGGLDVVNAALLFFCARHEGRHNASLGSARPAPVRDVVGGRPFASNGTVINSKSSINRPRTSRYVEPLVSKYLDDEPIYYIARMSQDATDPKPIYRREPLRKTIDSCFDELDFQNIVFVDGGGDSLLVRASDSPTGEDPFKGGDAEMLAAIRGRKGIVQAIISVGLDIKEEKFFETLNLLKARGGYYGKVNLVTGEKSDYRLDHLFKFDAPFGSSSPWIQKYFELCEKVLVLTEKDLEDDGKMMSHTGVVTYWALKQQFGVKRTFVQWEPVQPDGSKGALVRPEHCWMYFVDPTELENIKVELHAAL